MYMHIEDTILHVLNDVCMHIELTVCVYRCALPFTVCLCQEKF